MTNTARSPWVLPRLVAALLIVCVTGFAGVATAEARTLRGTPQLSVDAAASGARTQLTGTVTGKAGSARSGVRVVVERKSGKRWHRIASVGTKRAGKTRTFKTTLTVAPNSCGTLRITVTLRGSVIARTTIKPCEAIEQTPTRTTPLTERVTPTSAPTAPTAPTSAATPEPAPSPTGTPSATATPAPTGAPSATAAPTPTTTPTTAPASTPSSTPTTTPTPSPTTAPIAHPISAGRQQSCALENGKAWCWGDEDVGGPYYDMAQTNLTPEPFAEGVRSLATSSGATCALLTSGSLKCRLVHSSSEGSGEMVPGVSDAASVAIGGGLVCFVRVAGTVGCFDVWDLASDHRVDPEVVPVTDVPGVDDAVAVAVGGEHYCVARATGTVVCFGANAAGQLGVGNVSPAVEPKAVVGLSNVTDISAAGDQTCALRADGTVWCWGKVWKGTSSPYREGESVPTKVVGVVDARSISLHADFACFVRATGAVSCWGEGSKGQLGDGTSASSGSPVTVSGLTNATAVAAGDEHACAIDGDGGWWCWGSNEAGQLGNGFSAEGAWRVSPPIPGIGDAKHIDAEDQHSCVVRSGGAVSCWGANAYGQLGRGTTSTGEIAAPVTGVSGVSDVAVGDDHSCALLTAGDVKCWGRNTDGQLGDGTAGDKLAPTAVEGLDDATSIAAGASFTCALREGGSVACWGRNDKQQLGTFVGVGSDAPVAVAGITDAIVLDAGTDHACVIRADHHVVCWGANDLWQAGDPDFDDPTTTPRRVPGITNAVTISVGANACASMTNNEVNCWGRIQDPARDSAHGSRGIAPVDGMGGPTPLSAGRHTICQVSSWGQGQCFGWPVYVAEDDWNPVPHPVLGLDHAVEVAAGMWTTCFVINDGTVRCRGWNHQLANGVLLTEPAAVRVLRP